jgi:hypothetical protein
MVHRGLCVCVCVCVCVCGVYVGVCVLVEEWTLLSVCRPGLSRRVPVDTSLDPATRPPPPLDLNDPSVRKAMIASAVGNVLEWFDFGVFAFLSPQIGKLFFPSSDRFVSTLNAYVVFGGGFIFRPLGGLVLAHIGTVHGRKTALLVSVVGMAGATATMGCLPTYHDVGPLAPVLLSILRLIQGLSVGGEFVGSIVFAVESMPPHRQVLGGALCMSGAVAGLTMGSATGLILHAIFTPEQVLRFGWRIPFWCGLFIGIFALWLRREVHEPGGGVDGGDGEGWAEALASGETVAHKGPGVGEVGVGVTAEAYRSRQTETDTHRGWPHRGPGVCEICVRDKHGNAKATRRESKRPGATDVGEDLHSLPVLQAVRTMPAEILLCFGGASMWSAAAWLMVTFPPTLYQTLMSPPLSERIRVAHSEGAGELAAGAGAGAHGHEGAALHEGAVYRPGEQAVWAMHTGCCALLGLAILGHGFLGDILGGTRLLLLGALGTAMVSPVCFYAMSESTSLGAVVVAQGLLVVVAGSVGATLPSWMVHAFPKHLRFSAIAIGYNAAQVRIPAFLFLSVFLSPSDSPPPPPPPLPPPTISLPRARSPIPPLDRHAPTPPTRACTGERVRHENFH